MEEIFQSKIDRKPFDHYQKEFNENFNWKRVYKAMLALEWYWCFRVDEFNRSEMGIPSLDTIKIHAFKLLKIAYDSGSMSSSGGFVAGWEGNEMFLTFTIEEWTSYTEQKKTI